MMLVGAFASLAPACGEGTSGKALDIEASFAPGVPRAARDEAIRVEAYLVDSCDLVAMPERPGEAIQSTYMLRDGREGPSLELPDSGEYGLYALAQDSSCAVVAAGCAQVTITAGTENTVSVLMGALPGAGCSADEQCSIVTGECSAGGTGGAGGSGGTVGTGGAGGIVGTGGASGAGGIPVDDNWLDPNWLHRARISFDNTAQTTDNLDDFPLLVTINRPKLPSLDLSATVGADVRFTDAITGAELSYEVQSWDQATDQATIWVKVPRIDAGSATDYIYIYYNYDGTAAYDQSAADEAAVWPSGTGVYHLEDDPGPGNTGDIEDSDVNPNDGTAQSGFATNDLVAGRIGNGIEWESGDDVITFGQWNHISIDVDRTTGTAVVYHNGENVTADGTVLTDFDTSSGWVIGTMKGSINEGNNFLGVIDEVRIENSTQTDDWAKVEYLTQYGADAFNRFASEESVTPGG